MTRIKLSLATLVPVADREPSPDPVRAVDKAAERAARWAALPLPQKELEIKM